MRSAPWISSPETETGRSSGCARPGPRSTSARQRSALALRAVVGVPPAHLDGLDRRPAAPAREAEPPVHLELVLELPGLAEQIDVRVVVERGAPVADRVLERLLDRAVEPTHLLRRQRVRHAVVAEPRREEHLVGVDVAEPRDELLIHQER